MEAVQLSAAWQEDDGTAAEVKLMKSSVEIKNWNTFIMLSNTAEYFDGNVYNVASNGSYFQLYHVYACVLFEEHIASQL